MKLPELLAPAGDLEKLKTAIHYGADAVYFGDSRFSLRGRARNFYPEELISAVTYAHDLGVRAYVTVNIFPHNSDLAGIEEHIEVLKEARPDAVILSDLGVFMMSRKKAPEIDIHTAHRQMSLTMKPHCSGKVSGLKGLCFRGSCLLTR